MQKGFTLLETVIYIALLSIIVGGSLVATFQILEGLGRVSIKTTTQEEGNFVLRKLDWILSDVKRIDESGSVLTVTAADSSKIKVRLDGQTIVIEDSGETLPITTENVSAADLVVEVVHTPATGVVIHFILDSTTFELTKYMRL